MKLRDMLKRDFGLDLDISGGFGQSSADPIVLLDANPARAILTLMQVLACLGRGRGILWRTLGQSKVIGTPTTLEKVRIETKELTETEIISQVENYYFDVRNCNLSESELRVPQVFMDGKSGLHLPFALGWLHYSGIIDNTAAEAGLGVSISYSAPGTKATVYLYDKDYAEIPSGVDSIMVEEEYVIANADVLQFNQGLRPIGDLFKSGVFLKQLYADEENYSLLAMGAFR